MPHRVAVGLDGSPAGESPTGTAAEARLRGAEQVARAVSDPHRSHHPVVVVHAAAGQPAVRRPQALARGEVT